MVTFTKIYDESDIPESWTIAQLEIDTEHGSGLWTCSMFKPYVGLVGTYEKTRTAALHKAIKIPNYTFYCTKLLCGERKRVMNNECFLKLNMFSGLRGGLSV